MLGTPWPSQHVPPEAPYGLGTQRTLQAYEAFAGVDFRGCRVAQRGRLGGQAPELFAPLWADEQRVAGSPREAESPLPRSRCCSRTN